jgi:hypothetical protein
MCALTKMLVKCMLPVSIIQTQGFSQWLQCVDPSFLIPDRETVKSHLTKTRKVVIEKTRTLFASVEYINVSLDSWTDAVARCFTGFIAQFIDNDWKMHTVPFEFIDLKG